MTNVKLGIFYYSSTGTNYRVALSAQEAAQEAGVEVRLKRVEELAPKEAIAQNPAWQAHVESTQQVPIASLEDLEWADAFLFSAPTRFGNVPSQMKQFLDITGGLWLEGKLANKVVSACTSASNIHGGHESTLLNLYTTFYHWGAIVVTPGYTDPIFFGTGGNPYGTSLTVQQDGSFEENRLQGVQQQTKRLITVTQWIKQGQSS